MYKISIPKGAKAIILGLRYENHEAYVVGGCVRDSLLGREPKDWDICTSATPQEVKEHLNRCSVRAIDTGLKHGTVTADMERAGKLQPSALTVITQIIAALILSHSQRVFIRICPAETLPSMRWRITALVLLTPFTV